MPPRSLEPRSLTLSLTAADLKKSIHFYTEGLGFAVSEKWEEGGVVNGVMLKAGDTLLGLSQDDFAKGRDRSKGIGMRLYIETAQDLGAIARQAKSAGIALESEPGPLPWGQVGFSLADPDGYKLTISNPQDESKKG